MVNSNIVEIFIRQTIILKYYNSIIIKKLISLLFNAKFNTNL